jgi:hypothetical protein
VPVISLTPARAADVSGADGAAVSAGAPTGAMPSALRPLPGRGGYAFDQPASLLRQRLFGLAHGVSLLAAACVELPEQSVAVQQAYADWYARHARAIETVVRDLGVYYFGEHPAADVQWLDITHALGLKEDIRLALGEFELSVACVTLTQAMAKPRYDLTALLREEPLIALALIDGVPPPAAAATKKTAPAAPADAATDAQATAPAPPSPAPPADHPAADYPAADAPPNPSLERQPDAAFP